MILFIFIILSILGLLLLVFKGKISYLGAILLVTSVSIPDLYYVPRAGDDLYRYFSEMSFVSQFSDIRSLLNFYVSTANYHELSFIYNIYQWLLSKTGIFNLLPFFSVFICYLCLIIPFIYLRNNNYINIIYMFIGFLSVLILLPYFNVSSTIRWTMASGIFFFDTFLYFNVLYKHKFLALLMYVPLVFIHEAMIIPIALIFICPLIKKIKWYYILIFCVIFMLAFLGVSKIQGAASNSLLGISSKYSTLSVEQFIKSGSSKLSFFGTLFIPYLWSIGSLILIKDNKKEIDLNPELNTFVLFNLIDIILLPSLVTAQRYVLFVGMSNIFLLMKILRNDGRLNKYVKLIYILSIFLGICIFIISIHSNMHFNFYSIINYNY